MATNNHIKRFYKKVWKDIWSWLKPILIVIVWLNAAFMVILGIVFTGVTLTQWLYGPIDGVLDVDGGTILTLGFAPYLTVGVLYLLWKYIRSVWTNTKENDENKLDPNSLL